MIKQKKQARFALIIGFLLLPLLLSGEEIPDTEAVEQRADRAHEKELLIEEPQTPSLAVEEGFTNLSFFDFARMFLVLGGVILLIYLVYFLLKKAGGPKYQGNNLIRVVSSQNLQGNRNLHLVEVGNEVFLIGSAEGAVQLVSSISDKETLDQIKLFGSETAAGEKSFAEMLFGIFGKSSSEENEKTGASNEYAPNRSTLAAQALAGSQTQSGQGSLFLQRQKERLKKL